MRYLLDTCTFLWLVAEPDKLSTEVYDLLLQPEYKFYLSTVTAVEICTKYQTGKLKLSQEPNKFIKHFQKKYELIELPISTSLVDSFAKLPLIHRDPFDRLLIAQAVEYRLTILTPDRHIAEYEVEVMW